jgi:hypothetical protein
MAGQPGRKVGERINRSSESEIETRFCLVTSAFWTLPPAGCPMFARFWQTWGSSPAAFNCSQSQCEAAPRFKARIAGVFYLLTFVTGIYLSPYNLLPGIVGEGALTLWLLAMGVNGERWKEQSKVIGRRG